ncbi:MAG: hypothetical protein H6633_25700 [Anaerolineales bacterium]|nr:hypothetical protein [Anaerolineales bacterium]
MPTFEEVVIANEELSPLQIKVIGAMMASPTITEAAEKMGINRSTIHKWRVNVPGFREAEQAARQQLASEIMSEVRATWQAELAASRSR